MGSDRSQVCPPLGAQGAGSFCLLPRSRGSHGSEYLSEACTLWSEKQVLEQTGRTYFLISTSVSSLYHQSHNCS